MDNIVEAWKRGKSTRKKQDDVIALFIANIRNIEDMKVLESLEQQLQNGEVK